MTNIKPTNEGAECPSGQNSAETTSYPPNHQQDGQYSPNPRPGDEHGYYVANQQACPQQINAPEYVYPSEDGVYPGQFRSHMASMLAAMARVNVRYGFSPDFNMMVPTVPLPLPPTIWNMYAYGAGPQMPFDRAHAHPGAPIPGAPVQPGYPPQFVPGQTTGYIQPASVLMQSMPPVHASYPINTPSQNPPMSYHSQEELQSVQSHAPGQMSSSEGDIGSVDNQTDASEVKAKSMNKGKEEKETKSENQTTPVLCINGTHGLSIDDLHCLCSLYGRVLHIKIPYKTRDTNMVMLVQFDHPEAATRAFKYLKDLPYISQRSKNEGKEFTLSINYSKYWMLYGHNVPQTGVAPHHEPEVHAKLNRSFEDCLPISYTNADPEDMHEPTCVLLVNNLPSDVMEKSISMYFQSLPDTVTLHRVEMKRTISGFDYACCNS